jgi:D-amino peptidase
VIEVKITDKNLLKRENFLFSYLLMITKECCMKVFISADMEGVSGLTASDEMVFEGREFERGRRFLTDDVNAAIQGAFDGGATHVLVNESHWMMRNLLTEDIDSRAEVIRGIVKRGCMMEGLDESFDAVFFIGYHSKHGTPFGVMNHTMLGKEIQNLYLNGKPVGEMTVNAAFAGQVGVPVVLLTGDQTAVREAKEVFGEGVETVAVKEGRGRFTAKLLHPSVAQAHIREAAKRAVQRSSEVRPFIAGSPASMGFEFTSTDMAEVCSWVPTVELVGPRSVEFTFTDWREGMGLMFALLWLALHVADQMY